MVAVLQFTVLLSFILSDSVVAGISDMAGQQFVLAFPTPARDNRTVHFLLYTPEVMINITVNMSTKWSTVESIPERSVIINREEMKLLTIQESFSLLDKSEEGVVFGTGKYLHGLAHTDISEKFTYVLNGDGRFCVTVIIHDTTSKKNSMAALQALPVEGWGKVYFAVTLHYQPSIQIATVLENTVTINIRSATKKFFVKYNELYYSDKGFMLIKLPAYKGFSLQACPNFNHNYGELTGTEIEGQNPIGVISGNCEGYDDENLCSPPKDFSENEGPLTDIVMETLLPQAMMGTSFILYAVQADNRYGKFIVLASQDATITTYHIYTGISVDKIPTRGNYLVFPGANKAGLLTTNYPVSVFLIHHNKCLFMPYFVGPGDGAMTVIVPIGLFNHFYVWLTPDISKITGTPMKHYLSYICEYPDATETLLFDNVLIKTYWQTSSLLYLSTSWYAGELEIKPGQHELFSTVSAKIGAYLYGIGKWSAYMYPAGFISSPINDTWACTQITRKGMVRGDLIDNDCDGKVDEEKANNVDDDNDGKVDEDVVTLPPRNGTWGQWNPWWCSNCNGTIRARTRQCNKPFPIRGGHNCLGERMETNVSQCFDICYTVHGAWGDWQPWICSFECGVSIRTRNCDNPAPKFNGLFCRGDNSQNKTGHNCLENCPKGLTTTRSTAQTARQTTTQAIIEYTEAVPLDGSWGAWSNWACPANCHEKQMLRKRSCDSPPPDPGGLECLGPPLQLTEDELCNAVCPDDCPDGFWGLNCTNNCTHCDTPCDKKTGICETCKPGYKLPKLSCHKECDAFFYGFDCRGNCILDCAGQDCIDKAKGTCPPSRKKFNYIYLLFLLLLVPMGILCYLPHRYTRRDIGESDFYMEYENTEMEMYSNVDGPLLMKKTNSRPTETVESSNTLP